MGIPVEFKGQSHVFGRPKGVEADRCGSLPCFINKSQVVCAWQLTTEELEAVKETGIVYVSVWSAPAVFPIFVGDRESVRKLVADFGKPF